MRQKSSLTKFIRDILVAKQQFKGNEKFSSWRYGPYHDVNLSLSIYVWNEETIKEYIMQWLELVQSNKVNENKGNGKK